MYRLNTRRFEMASFKMKPRTFLINFSLLHLLTAHTIPFRRRTTLVGRKVNQFKFIAFSRSQTYRYPVSKQPRTAPRQPPNEYLSPENRNIALVGDAFPNWCVLEDGENSFVASLFSSAPLEGKKI